MGSSRERGCNLPKGNVPGRANESRTHACGPVEDSRLSNELALNVNIVAAMVEFGGVSLNWQ